MKRLEGQVAWISGGTSGIGEAAAVLFAREGAAVAISGRNEIAGQRIVEKIKSEGGRGFFSKCDVAQGDAIRHSINQTVDTFGGLQILVNNAGIVEVRMLHDYSEEEWDFLMAVNVKSIFHSLKFALPHLRKNERSYVVNNGSISSFVGQGATPGYTTSKGAVLQLSRSIALDYAADHIRCNCVCPGITDTPMLREHIDKTPDPEETLRRRLLRIPLGIALTPMDVAKAMLYFSCEDSAGITGTSLIVDGGYLAAAEWDNDVFRRMKESL